MSLNKHQSVTSDTRITGSLNYSQGHPKIAKQVLSSENAQLEFLRGKNAQLQQRVNRLSNCVRDLQKNKVELLLLNQKYVKIVNQYYRRGQSIAGKQNKNNLNVLHELEKDHRNLVKHCLNMEQQIKNYTLQMKKFNQMKVHLISVNHTNTKQLIQELTILTQENRLLKKQNNHLSFQLQKSKQQCAKLKKGKQQWEDKADLQSGQLERYKSLVNTIQQESQDKSNEYQSKIYELEIKVQKLQAQLRRQQQYMLKTVQARRKLELASVQHTHERQNLRKSLHEKKSKSKVNHSMIC